VSRAKLEMGGNSAALNGRESSPLRSGRTSRELPVVGKSVLRGEVQLLRSMGVHSTLICIPRTRG
jgi:hypothetical protein